MKKPDDEAARILGGSDPPKKRNKMGNIPTTVDGIRFASRKEARRYGELLVMQRAGVISGLKTHTSYELVVGGVSVGSYSDDFSYIENGLPVTEDTKSLASRTEAYQLRKRLMKAIHGIDIKET